VDDPVNLFVFILIVGARLLVPLWIPRFPLPAILLALVLDGVDGGVFERFTTLPLDNYQSYDKALDIYYLTIAYLSTIRNWTNQTAVQVGAFLLYFRLVGVLIFEFTNTRAILFIFPNTFEYFFIFYELVRLRWNPERMGRKAVYGAAAAIWIVIKLPQEYWIHIAQRDVTDTLAENPVLIPILGVSIAIILGVAYWIIMHRMPPADHVPSFAVPDPVPAGRMAATLHRFRQNQLRDQGLLEKAVLISLISTIFSQILPRTTLTATQTIIGVAIVVVVNALISEVLARRGMDWSSAMRHFGTMVVINGLLAVTFLRMLPGREEGVDVANLIFLLFLVSLLVTLFDRFRAIATGRRESEGMTVTNPG